MDQLAKLPRSTSIKIISGVFLVCYLVTKIFEMQAAPFNLRVDGKHTMFTDL